MTVDISVIMPVYNSQNFLEEAIRSVLNQTFTNFELIIINDGSTDRSDAIIKGFADERIVYVKQENKGQVIASNKGIELAKGAYIKFFDADDLLNDKHLEIQYRLLNGSKSHLASCQWSYFFDKTDTISFKSEYTDQDYTNPLDWYYDVHHFDSGMLGAWRWLIPRELLDKAGYWDSRLSLNNDFDFSTRLICASEGIRFAQGAKLFYRKGNMNALTHSKNKKAYESALLTTELAMQKVLNLENSERMRQLFADRFQGWIYKIYPQFKDVTIRMEGHVERLGGSSLKPEGGKLFKLLSAILPWKIVMHIQFVLHKSIWRPMLVWKNKQKMNRQFVN